MHSHLLVQTHSKRPRSLSEKVQTPAEDLAGQAVVSPVARWSPGAITCLCLRTWPLAFVPLQPGGGHAVEPLARLGLPQPPWLDCWPVLLLSAPCHLPAASGEWSQPFCTLASNEGVPRSPPVSCSCSLQLAAGMAAVPSCPPHQASTGTPSSALPLTVVSAPLSAGPPSYPRSQERVSHRSK